MGKSKAPISGDSDDESTNGSQKGPGESDHAPSLDHATQHGAPGVSGPPSPVPAIGHQQPMAAMSDAHMMPGQGPGVLGPEHMEALQALMQSHGGQGFDAKGTASAKEHFASIQKHRAK